VSGLQSLKPLMPILVGASLMLTFAMGLRFLAPLIAVGCAAMRGLLFGGNFFGRKMRCPSGR